MSHRRIWNGLLGTLLLLPLGCSEKQQPAENIPIEAAAETGELSAVDQAAEETSEAWEATEDPAVKVSLARDFLERYPDSEHTGDFLSDAVYYLLEELDRPEEAYEIVEGTLARIEDPDIRLDAQMQLAVLHSKTGRLEELSTLAETMAQEHDFQFTDHLRLMELASEASAWNLVLEQVQAGLTFATPEAFKAQWPDIDAEDAARWGRRRIAYCLAYKGWAQQNLGQPRTALATFSAGADDTTYSMLGVDDTPLHLYWGKALLAQGEPTAAMDKLSVEALFGSQEAREVFAEAWIAAHGSDAGLEEQLWSLRQEHSRALPQFALPNYDGETVSSTQFIGDVLLIAAWNPT
jgi:hypothetical protein